MSAEESQKFSIRQLLSVMAEKEASDLYITVGMPPSYRINNVIYPAREAPLNAAQCEQLADSAMNEQQRATFATDYEMNLSLAYPDLGRFRVNIFRQRSHTGMVIRQIKTVVPTIDELDLPEVFKDIVMSQRGLVLMVGATGCGKSTSLAAMTDWRNSNRAGHIIAIEDPIEFVHEHKKCIITQREVGADTLEYKNALKNTLRQAPDVILVGEIRDRESMDIAMEFAETGHLCMATLHAGNANQALERVINFFPKEQHAQISLSLALNLKAILCQRLVKKPDDSRLAATEILINTPRIADLIGKWDIGEIKEAMAAGENYGMHTFDQHLLTLWMDGIISEDEALRQADSINNLRLQIKMAKLEDLGGDSGDIEQFTENMDSGKLQI